MIEKQGGKVVVVVVVAVRTTGSAGVGWCCGGMCVPARGGSLIPRAAG